jgi:hypothetical protein
MDFLTALDIFRVMFMRNKVSKRWDIFGCFTAPTTTSLEPDESMPMDPSGTKIYSEEDDSVARVTAKVDPAPVKPVRKPDPSLRKLQRQISDLGSLRRRPSLPQGIVVFC